MPRRARGPMISAFLPLLAAACIGAAGVKYEDQEGGDGGRRYASFLFPPPDTCFGRSDGVYLSTAVSDGLFKDAKVKPSDAERWPV